MSLDKRCVTITRCAKLFGRNAESGFSLASHRLLQNYIDTIKEDDSEIAKVIDSKLGSTDWRGKIDDIIENKSDNFSDDEIAFSNSFSPILASAVQEVKEREDLTDLAAQFGLSHTEAGDLYETFIEAFPYNGDEVISQVVSAVMRVLDMYVRNGRGNDHLDVLMKQTPEIIFQKAREMVEKYATKYYSEENKDKIEDFENAKQMAYKVFSDSKIWNSIVYQAKRIFFEAEKIRLGKATSFVKAVRTQESTDVDDNGVSKDLVRSEEDTRERWMKLADTISTFGSLTKEARSILYSLWEGKNGEVVNGILGLPKTVDVMKVHNELLDLVYKRAVMNSDELIDELKKLKSNWAMNLVRILTKDENKKTTMFVAYYNNRLNYHHINVRRGKAYLNSSSDNSNTLIMNYRAEFYDIDSDNKDCIYDHDGAIKRTRLEAVYKQFYPNNRPLYINEDLDFTQVYKELNDAGKEKIVAFINRAFNLHMNEEEVRTLTQNGADDFIRNFYSFIKLFVQLYNNNSIRNIDTLLKSNETTKVARRVFGSMLNRINRSKTVYSKNSPVEKSTRYKGSTYMSSVVPGYVGDLMQRIRHAAIRENAKGLRKFLVDNFLKDPILATRGKFNKDKGEYEYKIHNRWLEDLYNTTDEDINDGQSFFNRFTTEFTRGLGNEQKEFENFIESDNYAFIFSEYCHNFNKDNYSKDADTDKKNRSYIGVPLFVTGDSNSCRFLTVYHRNYSVRNFFDVAERELFKMIELENRDEVQYIKDNKYLFSYFPALNGQTFDVELDGNHYTLDIKEVLDCYRFWVYKYDDVNDAIKILDKIKYFSNNKSEFNYADELKNNKEEAEIEMLDRLKKLRTAIRTTLNKKVETLLNEGFVKFKEDLADQGFIEREEIPGSISFKKEYEAYIPNWLFRSEGFNANDFLRDWYYNNKYNTIQQLQFLTIDPAFYEDTNQAQKRYKEMIASGKIFDTTRRIKSFKGNPDDMYGEDYYYTRQNVVYFNDIKRNMEKDDPSFMDTLKKEEINYLDEYNHSSLTDGQAYRSLDSYRNLMQMMGGDRWTQAHENVWIKIKTARKEKRELTKKERQYIADQKVSFQPLKLYYYGFEDLDGSPEESVWNVPVQIKYAEIPLIPELLPKKAFKLKEMARFMEDNDVDLIAATSCVKVGAYGSVDIDNDNPYESLGNAVVHSLSLQNLREQNNVPEHNDIYRAMGTQLTKHGFMSLTNEEFGNKKCEDIFFLQALRDAIPDGKLKLTDNESIDLEGDITGKDMMKLWNVLGSTAFIKAFRNLNREFGSNKDVSKMLSSMQEMSTQHTADTVLAYQIDENGELAMPVSELTMAMDNFASMISKFKKEVIKRNVKGGSLVQVSALGFDDDLEVKKIGDNMFEVECVRPFDFSYIGFNGEEVELDYFEYVNYETGMLVDEDGNDVEAGEGKSKLEKRFPGILDMIAYRIPTEKAYSILNLKTKRFLPKTLGGIIMVPTQFTTVAGFDFDIDKLYFIAKEYRLRDDIDDKYNGQIWSDYYGISESPVNKESKQGKLMYKYLIDVRASIRKKLRDDINNLKRPSDRVLQNALDKYLEALKEYESKELAYSGIFSSAAAGDEKALAEVDKVVDHPLRSTFYTDLEKAKRKMDRALRALDKTRQKGDAIKEEYLKKLSELIAAYQEHLEQYDRLYKYWDEALAKMESEGIDISNIPNSPTKAFREYIGKSFTDKNVVAWANDFNPERTLFNQHQSCLNNMMVDFLKFQLTDKRTLKERFTPGGYYNFKRARGLSLAIRYGDVKDIKTLEELQQYAEDNGFNSKKYKFPYDITEMSTLVHYQTWNALYDKLIGMAANQSINQRLTALMHKYELKKAIRFGSLIEGDSNSGKNLKARYINGVDTELITTEMLAAAVDAVKDALLEFFGIDDKIFSIACLMTRIGATPTDITLLLNQPIVREACKKVKASNGRMSLSDALDDALGNDGLKLIDDENSKTPNKYIKDVEGREKLLSSDNLVNALGRSSGENFKDTQLAVVAVMKELQIEAQHLSQQVKISKTTSTNTISSNPGDLIALILTTESIDEEMNNDEYGIDIDVDGNGNKTIINPKLLVTGDGSNLIDACIDSPFMMEQVAFSTMRTFLEGTLGAYFPYFTEGYQTVMNSLKGIVKNNVINGDMINDLIRDIPQYLISRIIPEFSEECLTDDIRLVMNGNEVTLATFPNCKSGEKISRRDFYNAFFPEYLKMNLLKNKQLVKEGKADINYMERYPMLAALFPESFDKDNDDNPTTSLTIPEIGRMSRTNKDRLKTSWYEMLESSDPFIRNVAQHLFFYSYFRAGLTFSPLGFSSVTSTRMLLSDQFKSYRDFFNLMFNIDSDGRRIYVPSNGVELNSFNIQDLLKSFIRNHYKQYYQICKQYVNRWAKNEILKQDPFEKGKFTIDVSNHAYDSLHSVVEKDKANNDAPIVHKFVPSIILEDSKGNIRLFICDDDIQEGRANFNISGHSMTYYEYSLPVNNKDYSTPVRKIDEDDNATNGSILTAALKAYRDDARRELSMQQETGTQDEGLGDHYDGSDGVLGRNAPSPATSILIPVMNHLNQLQGLGVDYKEIETIGNYINNLSDENTVFDTVQSITKQLTALRNRVNENISMSNEDKISIQDHIESIISLLQESQELMLSDKTNLKRVTNTEVLANAIRLIAWKRIMDRRMFGGRLGEGIARLGEAMNDEQIRRTITVTQLQDMLFEDLRYDNTLNAAEKKLKASLGSELASKILKVLGRTFDSVGRNHFEGKTVTEHPNLNSNQLNNLKLLFNSYLNFLQQKYGKGGYFILSEDFVQGALISGYSDKEVLTGKTDSILVTPDGITILDFKTGIGGLTEEHIRAYYVQLLLYKKMLEAAFPGVNVTVKVLHANQNLDLDGGVDSYNFRVDENEGIIYAQKKNSMSDFMPLGQFAGEDRFYVSKIWNAVNDDTIIDDMEKKLNSKNITISPLYGLLGNAQNGTEGEIYKEALALLNQLEIEEKQKEEILEKLNICK